MIRCVRYRRQSGAQAADRVAPTLGRNPINGLKQVNQDFLIITILGMYWNAYGQVIIDYLITPTYWISQSIGSYLKI